MSDRMPWTEAKKISDTIIDIIQKKVSGIGRIEAAGSLRRHKSTVKDIDIVLEKKSDSVANKLLSVFENLEGVEILTSGDQELSFLFLGVHVDIRIAKPSEYGSTLLFFTGNNTFNIAYRTLAKKKGFLLNRHGLFDRTTGKLIASSTEESIFKALGKPFKTPEEREY